MLDEWTENHPRAKAWSRPDDFEFIPGSTLTRLACPFPGWSGLFVLFWV